MIAARHVKCHNEHVRFLQINGLLFQGANYHGMGFGKNYFTDKYWKRTLRNIYYDLLKINNSRKFNV
jgi:CTP-dependent riboflavin kinase